MSQPPDHEERITALESRVERSLDAAAARHLAAAHDRDLSELPVKIEANRQAINALGLQTAGRFDSLEAEMREGFEQTRAGFEQVDASFAAVRAAMDQQAGGMQLIADLITGLGGQDGRPA